MMKKFRNARQVFLFCTKGDNNTFKEELYQDISKGCEIDSNDFFRDESKFLVSLCAPD